MPLLDLKEWKEREMMDWRKDIYTWNRDRNRNKKIWGDRETEGVRDQIGISTLTCFTHQLILFLIWRDFFLNIYFSLSQIGVELQNKISRLACPRGWFLAAYSLHLSEHAFNEVPEVRKVSAELKLIGRYTINKLKKWSMAELHNTNLALTVRPA